MTSSAIAFPLGLASSAVPGSGASLEQDAERAAIAACRRGEREAFDTLVARYQRPIYRLCYRYVNNHEDANDLAQEAFLKAWRAIGRFRGDSAFSTWLYRIAVNACLNHRALRRPATQELEDVLADPRPGAEARVERDDEARRVREAVSRLPDRQRATLILKVYHDLTHAEVAEILGSTVGTVKANLFHALGNLRRQMGKSEETRS
jgi:RNA polymerase sigma-70 factor, ECF subfamily